MSNDTGFSHLALQVRDLEKVWIFTSGMPECRLYIIACLALRKRRKWRGCQI